MKFRKEEANMKNITVIDLTSIEAEAESYESSASSN
jgi:hypothetical protein